MPVTTSRDPKTGKLTYKYEAPKGGFKRSKRLNPEDVGIKTPTKRYSEQQKEDRRSAQYNPGGVFENNPFRRGLEAFGLGGFVSGLDKLNADRQLRLLNENPDLRSSRFANVQKNIRDAAATGGFDLSGLLNVPNIDRRGTDEIRDTAEGGFVNNSGRVTVEDILRSRPGISEQEIMSSIGSTQFDPRVVGSIMTPAAGFGNSALASYIDPNRYNAFRTDQAYSTDNRPSGLLGNIYDLVGGTTIDEVMSTYPDNTATVVDDRPRGNFNNLPPTERSLSGGLLGTPQFSFNIAPFDNRFGSSYGNFKLRKGISESPFASNIGFNSNLTPSLLGESINIGNIGQVTDAYGNVLTGSARDVFLNEQFKTLQQLRPELAGYNLNILPQ